MGKVFSNGARAELANSITAESTFLIISEGGELFPTATVGNAPIDGTTGDWFKLVLQENDHYEIVYCRSHEEGDTIFTNLLRGQEGTTARAFPAKNTVVGLRPTAGDAADWEGLRAVVDTLHPVASSGSYNDLEDKPGLPEDATPSTSGLMSGADKTKLDLVGNMAYRSLMVSTGNPSGGIDGDVWLKVT